MKAYFPGGFICCAIAANFPSDSIVWLAFFGSWAIICIIMAANCSP